MTAPIKTPSNLLTDLARAKALFQQRTITALLTEGGPASNPGQICRRCRIPLRPGIAMGQTLTGGALDFPGDDAPITVSPGAPGLVIECLKCPDCGWSVTGGMLDGGGDG